MERHQSGDSLLINRMAKMQFIASVSYIHIVIQFLCLYPGASL